MYTILSFEYLNEDTGQEVYDRVATFKYKVDAAEYLVLNNLDESLYVKKDDEGIFSPIYFLKICYIDYNDILNILNLLSVNKNAINLNMLKERVL